MATISPTPKLQFLDANGDPLSYGLLYTYIAGTTTSKTTYTTAAQTTANTNPILLDSRGQADVWLLAGEAYKFTLQNSSGVLQYTVDQITAAGTMSTQNSNFVTITGGNISGFTITGPITGDVTVNLTGNVTGNLTGNVTGGSVVATSYNGGQLAGLRNKIINGSVLVNQRRQVSFVGTTNSSVSTKNNSLQCPDRWSFVSNTTAVMSVYQDADGPSSALNLNTCLKFSVTTADASPAAAEYFSAVQTIEGRELSSLVNKTFTISFWVKSSVIGVYSLALWSEAWGSGLSKSYVAQYSISVANTWEYKTITVINGLPSTTQWYLTDSIVGLTVGWALYSGTTYSTSATNTWNNASFLAAVGQVNAVATNGNVFALTGMQLEVGTVATPFEHRAFGLEYGLCLRYYEKSFSYGTTAAQNTLTYDNAAYGVAAFTNQTFAANLRFAVPKCDTPTITTYAPDASSANWSTNTTTPIASVVNAGPNGFIARGTSPTTGSNTYSIHWDANAEL